ncbi:hypothetical protein [Amycolatopsis sp. H20-H5]|uniref:hypothetical protein n=1 Tax=Amycolatopsis sp. H20-H5 TaxID=3046309 RepID=UPI002DB9FA98|nr:hypothetical protein [Amycolatopsis sp. H20-H5]MEC3978582.1 hypothetical protein [Amycolatopsis sp. H20-H5]
MLLPKLIRQASPSPTLNGTAFGSLKGRRFAGIAMRSRESSGSSAAARRRSKARMYWSSHGNLPVRRHDSTVEFTIEAIAMPAG